MKNRSYEDLSEFKKRRDQLNQAGAGKAFVLFSGAEAHLERFRANSDFVYLSGFEEPDSILVFLTGSEKPFHLFVRPKDPSKEIWDGFRYGLEGAKSVFGADQSYDVSEFKKIFPSLLAGVSEVHYELQGSEQDLAVIRGIDQYIKTQGRTGRGLLPIMDPKDTLGEMRVVKSENEIQWMKESCELSAKAHQRLMKTIQPNMNEKQIMATLLEEFHSNGALREGYFSIVASGANATILHYRDNNDICKDGDLLLVDAGAEKRYYTADITRTFPVNGKFTAEQKDIYSRVLKVQKQLIEMVKPGLAFEVIQKEAQRLLTEELVDLGFIKESVEESLKSSSYRKYYPHNIGHFLGMDVHDVGLYKEAGESKKLQPGMTFTIEPGLYIPADDETVPASYRGIGVRIEDNILVTSSGHEVMTATAPKEVSEIEALMA